VAGPKLGGTFEKPEKERRSRAADHPDERTESDPLRECQKASTPHHAGAFAVGVCGE
jgi:hypothetical protein